MFPRQVSRLSVFLGRAFPSFDSGLMRLRPDHGGRGRSGFLPDSHTPQKQIFNFSLKTTADFAVKYNMRIVPVKMKFPALSRFPYKIEAVFYRRRLANLPR